MSRNHVEAAAADTPAPIEDLSRGTGSSLPDSESINAWPDDAAEASFLSGSRESGTVPSAPALAEAVPAIASKPLPRLDELVERIPTESRELLEELFRAKFTTVRRVKVTDLKST
ncbi:MAG: hypothetical protein ABIV50_16575 [Opitutus sp.]